MIFAMLIRVVATVSQGSKREVGSNMKMLLPTLHFREQISIQLNKKDVCAKFLHLCAFFVKGCIIIAASDGRIFCLQKARDSPPPLNL